MNKIPVKFQLTILLAIPIIVLYFLFVVTYNFNHHTQRELKELLYEEAYQGATGLTEADRDMYQARLNIVQMIASASADEFNTEKNNYLENVKQVTERVQASYEILQNDSTLENLQHEESGKSVAQNVEAFTTNFDEWQSAVNALVAQMDPSSNINRNQYLATFNELNEKFAVTRTNLDEINQLIDIHLDTSIAHLDEKSNQVDVISTISIIAALLIIVLFGTFIIRRMMHTIKAIMQETERVANWDLTGEPLSIKRQDEFGKLATSVNVMKSNLRGLVGSVNDVVQGVVKTSHSISTATEETAASIEDVSKSIQDMAVGAAQGAVDAETTNEKVQQVSAQVQEVNAYTNSMLNQSSDAAKASENGMQQVQRLRETATASAHVLANVNEVMSQLIIKVKNIEGVIDVITGIAEQTNLLALNASIEAARAGEQGKGFAVVANEVRKLAEGSAGATMKIREMIQQILVESNNASDALKRTDAISQTQEQVTVETEQVFTAIKQSIQDIVTSIHEVFDGMQNITTLQSGTAGSIESMTAITEQTAAATEEVSAAAKEQGKTMNNVTNLSNELRSLGQELEQLLQRFTY